MVLIKISSINTIYYTTAKVILDIYVHKNYDDMKKAINQI